GPREHVMNAGAPVRSWWTFKEYESRPVGMRVERLLEEALILPAREQLALDVISGTIGRERLVSRGGGRSHTRSSTPRTSAVRFGSALFATAMMRSTVAGSSASGRQRSVIIDRPSTRIPA